MIREGHGSVTSEDGPTVVGETRSSGEKRRLVVNTAANGTAQLASMVASLVFMPLLISAFGLGNYGLYMLASSVAAYASLMDLGVGAALTKLVAEHAATSDEATVAESVSSALVFYLLVGLIVGLSMAVLGAYSDVVFRLTGDQALLMRNMLWLGALFQVLYWPLSTARHTLAGLQRYDLLATSSVLATVLSVAATLLVLWANQGPLVLVGLNGAIGAIVAVVNVVAVRRLLPSAQVTLLAASRSRITAILGFSWAVFVVQLSDTVFYQQTDRILLGVFSGAAAVGLYEAAAKFNALMTYLSGLTVSAVMPVASGMHAEQRIASLRALLLRGTKYSAALIAPLTVLTIIFAGPIIRVWLGPKFLSQVVVAQVLVFPHLAVCLGLMGDAIVIGKGRLARRVPYIVAQAVVNLVLSALLIGPLGVLGVAVGTAIAHLADFPFHVRFLLRETDVTLGEAVRGVVLPVYPLLVLPLVIGLLLAMTSLSKSLVGIAAAWAAALLSYWVAFYFRGLSDLERAEISHVLASLARRVRRTS